MKLEYDKVAELCLQMNSINTNMKTCLDNIKNALNSSSNNWSGKASESFLKNITDLSSTFDEFSEELNACILYMKKCSSNYEQVDEQVINGILSQSKFFS